MGPILYIRRERGGPSARNRNNYNKISPLIWGKTVGIVEVVKTVAAAEADGRAVTDSSVRPCFRHLLRCLSAGGAAAGTMLLLLVVELLPPPNKTHVAEVAQFGHDTAPKNERSTWREINLRIWNLEERRESI